MQTQVRCVGGRPLLSKGQLNGLSLGSSRLVSSVGPANCNARQLVLEWTRRSPPTEGSRGDIAAAAAAAERDSSEGLHSSK